MTDNNFSLSKETWLPLIIINIFATKAYILLLWNLNRTQKISEPWVQLQGRFNGLGLRACVFCVGAYRLALGLCSCTPLILNPTIVCRTQVREHEPFQKTYYSVQGPPTANVVAWWWTDGGIRDASKAVNYFYLHIPLPNEWTMDHTTFTKYYPIQNKKVQ